MTNTSIILTERKKRLIFPDIIKAVAIMLVVIGHNIQCGSGKVFFDSGIYFMNPLFRFIYSFHMPLFMLVSGYFFADSVKKYDTSMVIKKRISTLFIPILSWSAVPVGILILKSIISRKVDISIIRQIISAVLHNLWFLWAILVCSFIVLAISHVFKDSLWVYAGTLIIMMIIPDVLNAHYYKFMYPFFVAAYLWNKNQWFESSKLSLLKHRWLVLVGLVGIFGIFYIFYGYDSYIYTSGIYICKNEWLQQVAIDVFRWVIGFVGSIMVVWVIYITTYGRKNSEKNRITEFFVKIGINSLGIYILSSYIDQYILLKILESVSGLNYLLTILETVVILGITYVATEGIKRISILNRLLLGSR